MNGSHRITLNSLHRSGGDNQIQYAYIYAKMFSIYVCKYRIVESLLANMNGDSIARIEFIRPSMGARSDLDLYSTSL